MDKVPSPSRDNPRTDDPPARESVRVEERSALRIRDDGRSRQLVGDATLDPFDIADIMAVYAPTNGDPAKGNIENEIDFNWKRYEVYGEQNFSEWLTNTRQGWKPVQHADFPGRFAPPGTEGMVRVKDMVLMERPMRLTVQARNEELGKANRAMQAHRRIMAATPEGQAPRIVLTDKSSRETIEIPE
jgi:hypothetical protein